jgi:hypothetical protein
MTLSYLNIEAEPTREELAAKLAEAARLLGEVTSALTRQAGGFRYNEKHERASFADFTAGNIAMLEKMCLTARVALIVYPTDEKR